MCLGSYRKLAVHGTVCLYGLSCPECDVGRAHNRLGPIGSTLYVTLIEFRFSWIERKLINCLLFSIDWRVVLLYTLVMGILICLHNMIDWTLDGLKVPSFSSRVGSQFFFNFVCSGRVGSIWVKRLDLREGDPSVVQKTASL